MPLSEAYSESSLARVLVTPSATDKFALDSYIVCGLILAAAITAAYIGVRAVRRREWPDVGEIVLLVATTTAITAGARLGVVAVSARDLGPFRSEDRIFIPLAGVALILVATREVYKVFRDGAL